MLSFTLGPAALGMGIHLGVGLAFGAAFGPIAWALRRNRVGIVAAGAGYGLVVLVLNSFVLLPIAAGVFGAGEAISDMPTMVGWGTFTLEHAIYGTVLGLAVALALGADVATRTESGLETFERRPAA